MQWVKSKFTRYSARYSYNELLGGKPCMLLPIVRYNNIGIFSIFFSENSDIADKIVSVITEISYNEGSLYYEVAECSSCIKF